MKVINKEGYSEKERKDFVSIVHANVIQAVKNMLASYEKLGVDMPDDVRSLKEQCEASACYAEERLGPEIGELVKGLWATSSMKEQFD